LEDLQKDNNLFGIDRETYEKSKDIVPTFELGKIGDKGIVELTVLSENPILIEHKAKYPDAEKGIKEGELMKTPTLLVAIEKVIRNDGNNELLDIPYNMEKFTLWLSSKSLALGLMRLHEDNNKSLKGVRAKIRIGKTDYKKFGENTCYTVSQNL